MSETKSRKSAVTRTTTVTGDHRELDCRVKGLVVYRLITTTETTTVRNGRTYSKKPETRTREGVCKKTQLDKVLSGTETIHSVPQHAVVERGDWQSAFLYVTAGYLELNRTQGRHGDPSAYEGLDCPKPFTALENGEDVVLIESHGAASEVYDAQGGLLPTAVYFEYIDANMDNAHYDLEKAVGILRKRDDVKLIPNGNNRVYGDQPSEDDPEHWIGDIPGYNATTGCDRCIAFLWAPSPEDALRVRRVQALKEKAKGYYRIQTAVFDLDVFGLRAGGAAHARRLPRQDHPAASR